MTSIIGAYFRTQRVQTAAILYFLLAGLLTQVPLFNYLGFEFSAVMTIPAALISGILTIKFLREHKQKPLTGRTWLFVVIDYLHVNFLLLLIPLIVITLNAFAVKNCAYTKGLSYYLLLPMITMFFSVSLALVVGMIFRRSIVVFTIAVVGILSHIVFVTYGQPQLFAYNLIFGFFPGITYDETVGDMKTLLVFRELTIVTSLLCVAIFFIGIPFWNESLSLKSNIHKVKSHAGKNKVLVGCLLFCLSILIIAFLFRADLGFEYSSSDIQKQFGRRTESDHFIIYYSGKNYSMDQVRVVRAEAEFSYELVCRRLELIEKNKKKIEIFLFSSNEEKRKYIGTANTNIAKPWKREIHLTQSTFQSTFRHELVHILAGNFGFPLIHASTHMGFNEGLAVAIDWQEGMFTPHQYAAALMRDNLLENVGVLFSTTGFAVQSSSYAYLVSGSFCKYLIDRFGINRFKFAFANGNFIFAFGESIDALEKEWAAYLKSVDSTNLPPETVRALFLQPSIFYKTCAREVAEKNQNALKAIRVKNYLLAEQQFEASYSDAPTVFAVRGIFQSLLSQKKYTQVLSRFNEISNESLLHINPSLLFFLGDAYFLTRDLKNAEKIFASIYKMNYSEGFCEAAALRKQIIADGITGEMFHELYYSGLEDSAKIAVIQNAGSKESLSLLFAMANIEERRGNDSLAVNVFQKISNRAKHNILCYFSSIRTANLFYRMRDFESAKSAYWQAKNYAPTETVNDYLDEQIELCDNIAMQFQ